MAIDSSTLGKPRSPLFKARTRYFRWLILPALPLIAMAEPAWDPHSLVAEELPLIGMVLVFVGVLTRIFSTFYVGGRKNDVLMTDGPFSVVRNPLYVGSFLATAGLGFSTGSLIIAASVIVIFLVMHNHTIAHEESFLRSKFGGAYDAYYATTPRWIPRFSQWKSPAEVHTKPAFVLRTIRDGMVFVLAVPLLHALSNMRHHDTIPTIFFIY